MILFVASAAADRPTTNSARLAQLADSLRARYESWQGAEYLRLRSLTTGYWGELNADPNRELIGVREDGEPVILYTDNANAAHTTRADQLHPGGESGYDRDGSLSWGLAVWDNGVANPDHPEFQGHVNIGDDSDDYAAHANHTAGTLAAAGVNPSAKGMSFAAHLNSFDWSMDRAEMAANADWLKVSSHSYHYGGDYGVYDWSSAELDEIQFNAPYYSIVIAATNDGPSYGTIYGSSCGKNAITVGAVNDVDEYDGPGSVTIAGFSSRGPTLDGRLKPEIVANGVQLYSTLSVGYTYMSGTSMSTPNCAGTLFLLVEHYEQTHEYWIPPAATMKALICHTADECGPADGPDYTYGYGLMNAWRAADVISADVDNPDIIQQQELTAGGEFEYTFAADGTVPLKLTIAWTEPPGEVNANPALVNDLDLRLVRESDETTFDPWVMNPDLPWESASTGDNDVDNLEQVYVSDPEPGGYRVEVTHEGPLQGDSQFFTLVIDGLPDPDPVELTLSPYNTEIGPEGGELVFGVTLANSTDAGYPGLTFWTAAILPNGNEYGPLFTSPTFTLDAGATIEVDQFTQNVPAMAPDGEYTLIGRVGEMPDVWLADSFEFTKGLSAAIGDGDGADSWDGRGWPETGDREAASEPVAGPDGIRLRSAWPNPFNASTRFAVELARPAELSVAVFDVLGRRVFTLADGYESAGVHAFRLDADELGSGVYFVRAVIPGAGARTAKLVVVR
ncbi:MAG: Serine protease AprX [Calditrichaeota bacterium]|nr:Serine protease AprX [Calditrichota bacterium]